VHSTVSPEWLGDPFSVLGPHDGVVRTLQPGALAVAAVDGEGREIARFLETGPGLFEAELDPHEPTSAYRLKVEWPGAVEILADPYRFGPVLGDLDLHLFNEGRHHQPAQRLGAVPMNHEGETGTAFSVWAPNARQVSVIGDFNGWSRLRHPMRLRHGAGIWEIFLPGVQPGALYKFAVLGADGALREKADPLARSTELPPATASVVAPADDHAWGDADWMAARADRQHAGAPITIYEVHAASWKQPWRDWPQAHSWDELSDQLLPYVAEMGFTHVELMPIMEHPFGGSWGYQPLSQFAPSARFGPPDGFARFVDRAHQAGIGVILDWVPAHFPEDAHGLARFDGTALYEHGDPKEGWHPDWKTLIYNLGRTEVRGFLIASAVYWLETFHVDGLRVDAVASMLYRDYSRPAGAWTPNRHGGRENLESVAFLKDLNRVVAERAPGAITIAEESTAWPGVSASVEAGGLGFDYKWNMGWMNDTLRYFERDPIHRGWHGGDLGFGLVYAFSERFVLPLSHDEVVHGKRSLINKMPGDRWRRFANLRAYLGFMWGHPGKKLLFMGGEFAQEREWSHDRQLDWELLKDPAHDGMRRLVGDLNRLYREQGALHHTDADPRGFQWVAENAGGDSVFAFLRRSFHGAAPLLVVCNLTPEVRRNYRLGAPHAGVWREILNTDAAVYGGGNIGAGDAVRSVPTPWNGWPCALDLTIPPLGVVFLRYEGPAVEPTA
jgi:1,4-alpha-glucan branching enzyme